MLVREGLVSAEQIRASIESGIESGIGLGESLSALGYIEEGRLVEILSREYGVPSMDIDDCKADESVIRLIPGETAFEKFLVPVSVEGTDLTIAVSDPSNILLLDDLGFITGKNIKPVVASERSIRNKLTEYYGEREAAPASSDEDMPRETVPEAGPDRALIISDGKRIAADDVTGEPGLYEKDRVYPESVSDAEDARPSAGNASQTGNGEEPERSVLDEDIKSLKGTGEGYVFDFTDGIVKKNDLPLMEKNARMTTMETENGPEDKIPGMAHDPDRDSEFNADDGDTRSIEYYENGAPVSQARNDIGQEEKGSVLIVDFSPTVRKIMRIGLERAGYRVVSAGDGMQALASINESIPDLIFVDTKLPHMDGYQLCKVIKSHGLTKEVPVVLISGKAGVLDKMKIRMSGASDFITKPFGSEALVGAAERYAG